MIIRENIPISSLTTMRIGGPARYVFTAENPAEIPEAFEFADMYHLPTFILGGGANTIGHDTLFPGVIVTSNFTGITETIENGVTFLKIMGATPWDDVVDYAVKRNLTGIEALSKIPGQSGAAPVQNIGAYGQDVSETFVEAEAYDTKTHKFTILTKADFHFSYRKSILNTTMRGRFFIISITLALREGKMSRPFYNSIEKYLLDHQTTDFSPASIRTIVSTIRKDKLPDPAEKASSGSFFKNVYLTTEADFKKAEKNGCPTYHGHDGVKINSGWHIEQAGLKGKLLHGMRISDKAALVLINESATGYADLAKARAEIVQAVYDKFGFFLEQEPVEIPTASR